MVKLMLDATIALSPDFQVIMTEPADLKESWYREAIVERWRGDERRRAVDPVGDLGGGDGFG
jgi:hypothetical protein